MNSGLRQRRRGTARPGFTLVVVLTLLVLLTTLGIGLLSLSAIAIRSAGATTAQSTAQANARLALLLAIGDLQRFAGDDRRITAPGSLIDKDAQHPHLTGVWKSWKIDPGSPPSQNDYSFAGGKQDFFQGWLVSHPSRLATTTSNFAQSGILPDEISLLSSRTLGSTPGANDDVRASRIQISDSNTSRGTGSVAWAVLDEGVKARVDVGEHTQTETTGLATLGLGTGQRPAVERISGLEAIGDLSFNLDDAQARAGIHKMISVPTIELGATGTEVKPHFHDLTTHSLGLLTDTASGGLRQDLSLLTNNEELPDLFKGKGIYSTEFGLNIPSDPSWEQVADYGRMFRSPELKDDGGRPVIQAHTPPRWYAATSGSRGLRVNKASPPGAVVMPVVAKVQVVFSILARDIYTYAGRAGSIIPETAPQLHNPWGNNFRNSSYDYLLHMLYTPVISLYNPYNVDLEVDNLKVEFVDIPFALQVFRNGVAQNKSLTPFNKMYLPSQNSTDSKRFGMTLYEKDARGSPGASKIRFKPGEVRLFSPYIPPNITWASDVKTQEHFFDWRNENEESGRAGSHVDTSKQKAVPGWRGEGIGYDLDWFAPTGYLVSNVERENGKTMNRGGCVGLRRQDEIHLEFAPIGPDQQNTQFSVQLSAGSGRVAGASTIIEMDYETVDGLQTTMLGRNGKLRYPEDGTVNALQLLDHHNTPISRYVNPKPFALFSAYAKTTHGGREDTAAAAGGGQVRYDDGRYATKAWTFTNPVAPISSQKVITEHPAQHSHELDLNSLDGDVDEFIDVGLNDNGRFITGHTVFNGRTAATHTELPLAPFQTLTSLNHANLVSSGYLPRFDMPVGNSLAHPVMNSAAVIETGPGRYAYADHSFLLNLALYDRYFSSGLADTSGAPFMDGSSITDQAKQFFDGSDYLPDARLMPYTAGTGGTAASKIVTEDDGYTALAAHALVRGAFNVHSTSVDAWKAVLASMNGKNALCNQVNGQAGGSQQGVSRLADPQQDETRFSRFRLPNSEATRNDDDPTDTIWHGPRDLTETDLQRLAEEIVEQVRERGPFLSLGEFVNRQLGPASPNTLRGALQAAIEESGINEPLVTGARAGYEIDAAKVAEYEYRTPDAGIGPSCEGAPGMLSQSDILTVLGNAASVRSDTFRIRGYGDARDAAGQIVATAVCEAVVQRVPEFVDQSDPPYTEIGQLSSQANRLFGRRFKIVSFRWLSSAEV